MAYIEWYKKSSRDQGGYYDNYKNKHSSQSRQQIQTRQEVIKRHKILTQYWKRMVSEAEKLPQKEGANFRMRWLYGGTNYRRLVEPLDIADYYKKGHKDYMTRARSHHYVLLEKWYDDDDDARRANGERTKACTLTVDSCFWARVEEAIVSCGVLRDGESGSEIKRLSRDSLVGFEGYVMDLIEKFGASPEIFLAGSSFMRWWEEYTSVVGGDLGGSRLAHFMRIDYLNYV
ncbi:senescence-associated carboxylesterase 101 [Phtheirospermum japonicum]|uniref:Senescence-associated carboxylesterase 101 n=1 Tax=Phtheirospermum japonicum TaxID=374723 RepID=A0A830CDS5_9LAMI|nr:senescence-associated carboxylesterase 101 [Phtheirospermum japonicum]